MTDIKNPYCWVCYKDGSEAFCSKCGIGFHLTCFGDNFEDFCESASYMDEVIWIKECQECLKMRESRKFYTSMERKLVKFKRLPEQLLNSILEKIFTKGIGIQPFDEKIKTWLKNERFKKIISPIIDTIKSKLLRNAYTCPGEFLFDVKKIRHMVKSNMNQHPEVDFRVVDSYTRKIQENCQEMDICPYCVSNYLTKSFGSTEPCPWGHRLVFVDLSQGHFKQGNIKRLENLPPVFPAKIFRFERYNNGLIVVRHFGSLMSIKVPKSCVYLLRSIDIAQLHRLVSTLPVIESRQELENSLKMLKLHLMKLRGLYGNSALLADRKRLWHLKDGYFYSREREASMFKMLPGTSKRYTHEPESSDDEDDYDERVNLNVQPVSRSLSCQETYTATPLNHSASPENFTDQENLWERIDTVQSSQSLEEITDTAVAEITDTDQENISERMDIVPSSQSLVEITDTAAVEMVSCTPDLIFPEENHELYSQVTFSSSDDRVQIDNSFGEAQSIEITDFHETKPNLSILINQITSKTSPILIDLTQDDEEDEISEVLPEIEVNRPSVIISPLDLRKRNDSTKICSNKSDQINPKGSEANLKATLHDPQEEPLDLSLQSN